VKRLFSLALFAALATTVVSCSDSTSPSASLAGTYSLRTVNGSSLPVTLCCDAFGAPYQLLSAEISLDANGNYSSVDRYSDGTQTATGYWTLSGDQLTLVANAGFQTFATVSGNQLVLTNVGGTSMTAVYQR
jgi:hypothetical protein